MRRYTSSSNLFDSLSPCPLPSLPLRSHELFLTTSSILLSIYLSLHPPTLTPSPSSTGSAGLVQTIKMYGGGHIVAGILGTIATVGWVVQGAGNAYYYREVGAISVIVRIFVAGGGGVLSVVAGYLWQSRIFVAEQDVFGPSVAGRMDEGIFVDRTRIAHHLPMRGPLPCFRFRLGIPRLSSSR